MISTYLTDIIILLVTAVIAVPFFQAIRLGAVPGFLIAGIIVGPSGLALINNINEIGNLAEIGVVLLLFVIGIELKPSRLWLMRRMVFGLGTLQVLITGILLTVVLHFLFDIALRPAILIGPALALSSTAFVLQLLNEQKALASVYGRTSFSVLLLQDLAVVPLLALVPLLTTPELGIGKDIGIALLESLIILVLVILGGRYFLHPILHRVARSGSPEIFTASAVLIVLGTALITEHIGLSMAMGAFLAGLLISDSAYRHQVMAEIQPFRGLLLGLFFMSMGMSLNLSYFLDQPLTSLGLVTLLIVFKALILWILTYSFSLKGKIGLAVSLILAQSGEFALVLFALAYQSNLFSNELFQQLLLIVLISMLVTPALARLAQQLTQTQPGRRVAQHETPVKAPIVIAGYGRIGHRVGEILTIANQPYVALDINTDIVEKERAKGNPVFYGDVRQHGLLQAAGVSHAQLVIVTLDDTSAAKQVVASLRQAHPAIQIFARGHSLEECRKLKQIGASITVSETIEASLELAHVTMTEIGINSDEQNFILSEFRQSYYTQINDITANDNK